MMLCDVPLHPRTRSTKGPDCPNDIQKRLRSPRQHLDDRQHSINPLPKRPAIDQRTEFVRLVRIHELFRLGCRDLFRKEKTLEHIIPTIEDVLSAGGLDTPQAPKDSISPAIPNPSSIGDAGHRS